MDGGALGLGGDEVDLEFFGRAEEESGFARFLCGWAAGRPVACRRGGETFVDAWPVFDFDFDFDFVDPLDAASTESPGSSPRAPFAPCVCDFLDP